MFGFRETGRCPKIAAPDVGRKCRREEKAPTIEAGGDGQVLRDGSIVLERGKKREKERLKTSGSRELANQTRGIGAILDLPAFSFLAPSFADFAQPPPNDL